MLIKSYPKTHLAKCYSPELSEDSALRRLRRWINGDRDLKSELQKIGYFDHQRSQYFTKKEVALLFEYIGEP